MMKQEWPVYLISKKIMKRSYVVTDFTLISLYTIYLIIDILVSTMIRIIQLIKSILIFELQVDLIFEKK